MEIRRFFVNPSDVSDGRINVSGEEFVHAIKVLRHKVGYKIIACDNTGAEYSATIDRIESDYFSAKIDSVKAPETNSSKIALYMCISRKDRFDFSIQKAVELGVSEIFPVASEFSSESTVNAERLNKIIVEAAKQCGLSVLPKLMPVKTFDEAVKSYSGDGIMFYEHERKNKLSDVKKGKNFSLFVGAEGGFSVREAELAEKSGILTVGLGKRILRTETAAVVAVALISYVYGGEE